jgi:hypothetical protein
VVGVQQAFLHARLGVSETTSPPNENPHVLDGKEKGNGMARDCLPHLFQGFVIYEAGCVLGHLQLALLNLLAELPACV